MRAYQQALRLQALLIFLCVAPLNSQELRRSASDLAALSVSDSVGLEPVLRTIFTAQALGEGTAYQEDGQDLFFSVKTAGTPVLYIDNRTELPMKRVSGTDLWFAATNIPQVGLHSFFYRISGVDGPITSPRPRAFDPAGGLEGMGQLGTDTFGGTLDLAVFGPEAYARPEVPQGKLSAKMINVSKLYKGLKSEYWVYVPAQYDDSSAVPVMVYQDGGWYIGRRPGTDSMLNVLDNLTAQGKIPVMISVFVNPGDMSDAPASPLYQSVQRYAAEWKKTSKESTRSIEYDTVSDRYGRFLDEELLPEIGLHYKLRRDGYSRGLMGVSSGAIASFNAAWQLPSRFSRVISWSGSFASIQWKEDSSVEDGGQDFPDKILREPKKNLRVWIEDGAEDMENPRFGSWPLSNLRVANALKAKGYDFHLRFGQGTHSAAQGSVEFPQEMIWLWRAWDPKATSDTYSQDPSEANRPAFRVLQLNRTE